MATALLSDVTREGVTQRDLVVFLENVRDIVNEMQADHATVLTLEGELKTLVNSVRTYLTGNYLVDGDPGLVIDTNFDVKVANALLVKFGAVTLAIDADTSCDTGTAATFPAAKWGIFRVSVDLAGTLTATWATNSEAGYNSEALAIAALPATPAGEVSLGYVTVLADPSNSFTAGSDALQGGSGGNPSPDTNYVDAVAIDVDAVLEAAVTASPPATLSNSTALKLTAG